MSKFTELFTGKPSKSSPVIEPAAITKEQRQQLYTPIGNLAGFSFSPTGGFTPQDVTKTWGNINSSYSQPLQSALSNPFIPTSAEDQLLSDIMGKTSAQFANRGLGASPIAATSTAASIAPSLIQMRQSQIQNILAALGLDVNTQLGQRGQDINAFVIQRQMQLDALLKYLEQVGFPRTMGQESTGATPGLVGEITGAIKDVAGAGAGAAGGGGITT